MYDSKKDFSLALNELFDIYKQDPEGFSRELDQIVHLLTEYQDKKNIEAILFFGLQLSGYSYFRHAIIALNGVLKYIKNNPQDTSLDTIQNPEFGCYSGLGDIYYKLGEFRKSIEYQTKGLEIAVITGNLTGESSFSNNLGNAYAQLGEYHKAMEHHKRAVYTMEISEERENIFPKSAYYLNLGNAYGFLGDYRNALKYHTKALELKEIIRNKTGNLSGESICCTCLAIDYTQLGEYHKAIEFHMRAIHIAEEIKDRHAEATSIQNLGQTYVALGDYGKAIEQHNRALEIAKEIGSLRTERLAYSHLGSIYIALHNQEKAYVYFKKSIDLYEGMYQMLVQEEQKIGFQSTVAGDYLNIVPLCLKFQRKDKEIEALGYVERSKSRVLIDLMAASSSVLPTVPMTQELKLLIDAEKRHLIRLQEIQMQHIQSKQMTVDPGEVDRVRKELENIYVEIRRKYDKQYVSLRKPQPISLDEIQAKLASTGRNAAMVEYFVTEEKTFIFVVSQKELRVKEVELGREKLIQCAYDYQREVVQYLEYGDIGDFSIQELSKYLVEPISEQLSNVNLLYFVPHDMLHYIPLHALSLKGKPIITHFPVVYTPSASLMQYFRTRKSHLDNSASFGVVLKEDEEIFGEEAKMVSRLLSCQYFPNAKKQTVISNLGGKDILHFSCHGYFDSAEPLSSGIILDGNEYEDKEKKFTYDILTAQEIFNLKERMNADLVTVSACETGLSDRRPGDELVGLTRSLLYAGASSIVVSLWSVYARSTMEMMEEIYKELKEGKDKAPALQQAMVKIMMKPEYSHPYFWAPFLLVGDWE